MRGPRGRQMDTERLVLVQCASSPKHHLGFSSFMRSGGMFTHTPRCFHLAFSLDKSFLISLGCK